MDELTAIVQEARAAGTYVAAHAYTPAAIQRALAAGVRSIEHGNWLDDATARMMAGAWVGGWVGGRVAHTRDASTCRAHSSAAVMHYHDDSVSSDAIAWRLAAAAAQRPCLARAPHM
jgi:imidazolonepropionase-like amidohydrolase